MTAQVSELQSLRERVSHVLPLSVQERAARSLFQLRLLPEQDAEIKGVGVFFQHGVAVTADHNLGETRRGVRVFGRVVDRAGVVTELTFRVAVRDSSMDVALLRCEDETYAHFLELHTGDADELVTAHMALCSFQSAIQEELPEFSHRIGVFHAQCSKPHLP